MMKKKIEKLNMQNLGWVEYPSEFGGVNEFSPHRAVEELTEKINEIIDFLSTITKER